MIFAKILFSIKEFKDYNIPEFQDSRIPGFQNSRIPGFQYSSIPGLTIYWFIPESPHEDCDFLEVIPVPVEPQNEDLEDQVGEVCEGATE